MVPREAGGLGGSRVAFFEATEAIARADGSAGWCVGLCNGITVFIHRGATATLARGSVRRRPGVVLGVAAAPRAIGA